MDADPQPGARARQSDADARMAISRLYQRKLKDHVRVCPICRHNVAGCTFGADLEGMLRAVARLAAEKAGA